MSDLEQDVIGALVSAEARDLVAEYGELGIDAFLEEGLARDIPLIRSIVAIAKVGTNIRDRIFTKKLMAFLGPIAQVDPGERRQLIAKLEADAKYGRKVGEHIIEILDRIELLKKPKMVAAVFLAYLQGKIDALMLHRLNRAVEHVPLHELTALRPFCEAEPQKRDASASTLQALLNAGLLNAASGWGALVYQPNEISAAFLQLELDRIE